MRNYSRIDLAGEVRRRAAPPLFEGGNHVDSGRAVGLEARYAELDDVAGVPEAGRLVHVLVKPLVPRGEVELLDEVGEVGVEGAEEGDGLLEGVEGHEGVGSKGAVEVFEAVGEEGVEASD